MNEALTKTQDRSLEFIPFGAVDKIKLSVDIVKNLIAVPTKTGKTCSDRDAMKFIMLCQAQRLNPFAGDAFLIGYDGQNGAVFNLITAHQAFLKRAETCEAFEGMESGVILANDDGKIEEREGDFHLPKEEVVGGWARVHRKGRRPIYRRIRMDRFNNGFAQWKVDPAGMIVKCAEADALRSTFPTLLGGLYSEHEIIDVKSARMPSDSPKLVELGAIQSAQPETAPDPSAENGAKESPQSQLGKVVVEAGFTFAHLKNWLAETGNDEKADTLADFDDVPASIAARLLKSKAGLLNGLAAIKEVA